MKLHRDTAGGIGQRQADLLLAPRGRRTPDMLQDVYKRQVFVGSDERESGTLQMEALAKLANYKGNVAIMIGNLTDAGALQRTKDVELSLIHI